MLKQGNGSRKIKDERKVRGWKTPAERHGVDRGAWCAEEGMSGGLKEGES